MAALQDCAGHQSERHCRAVGPAASDDRAPTGTEAWREIKAQPVPESGRRKYNLIQLVVFIGMKYLQVRRFKFITGLYFATLTQVNRALTMIIQYMRSADACRQVMQASHAGEDDAVR
jgi:hypothetical protein